MGKSAIIRTVLVAEDDREDRTMICDAWKEAGLANRLRFVEDGEELLDYLKRRGAYENPADSPRPGLILLDLNMPRKDGRETIREIKQDADLSKIPVVVLTTSSSERDVNQCYELGASSYITKPMKFCALVETFKTIGRYWFETVELPN